MTADISTLNFPGSQELTLTDASPGQLQSWHHNSGIQNGQMPDTLAVQVVQQHLHVDALELSVKQLIIRHESLRTFFRKIDGVIKQVIIPYNNELFCIRRMNLQEDSDFEETINNTYISCAKELSDLESGPLIKMVLFHCPGNRYKFLVVIHHIISDAWSLNIIKEELNIFYKAFKNGAVPVITPLPMQLSEYCRQENKRFNERKTAEIAYWKEKLSKINGKYRRETIEALNNSAAATFAENITGQRYTALNTVAIACNINTAGVLYTCLSLLLHYITGRENVLIAASVTDRSSERTRRLIGRLVSGIYLYRSLRPQATIKEHIAEIYVDLLRSCRHSISNHEMLGINESALRANCDLFLNFEKKLSVETSCSVVKTGHQQEHGAYYALSCTITEFNDGLSLRWKYSHACYDQRRIEHISQRNNQILDYMSAYPQHSVGDMFRHLRLHKL